MATDLTTGRMRALIEQGQYASLLRELAAVPCEERANLFRSSEGGFCLGFAMLKSGLHGSQSNWLREKSPLHRFVKMRRELAGEDDCVLKLSVLLAGRHKPKGYEETITEALRTLLDRDPLLVFADDAFFSEVTLGQRLGRFSSWADRVPNPVIRELMEQIVNDKDGFSQKVIELAPRVESPIVLSTFGSWVTSSGFRNEGLGVIDSALLRFPGNGDLLWERARILRALDRSEEILTPEVEGAALWNYDLARSYRWVVRTKRGKAQYIRFMLKGMRPFLEVGKAADRILACYKKHPTGQPIGVQTGNRVPLP